MIAHLQGMGGRVSGSNITRIVCPSCGKPEAWTKVADPVTIQCNRGNHCGVRTYAKTFAPHLTLENIRAAQAAFSAERDWDQFHLPRNLALALVGEVGELCEIFQWKGDDMCRPGLPGWDEDKKRHVGQELSDCLLYLIRLADKCGIDLATATEEKIKLNGLKYPADKVKGSSRKYSEY